MRPIGGLPTDRVEEAAIEAGRHALAEG